MINNKLKPLTVKSLKINKKRYFFTAFILYVLPSFK
jgi:hypothetical protein